MSANDAGQVQLLQQYEALLSAQSTACLLLDAHCHIVWVNQATESLFQAGLKQIKGTSLIHWLEAAVDIQSLVSSLIANPGQPIKVDVQLKGAGESVQAVMNATQTTQTNNGAVALEFINHSHVLLVQASEYKLEQQTAQRGLLRNLAHEIRNPLGGIRGAAQLLERVLPQAEHREYTQVIVDETLRLQSLLDRLLSAQAAPKTLSVVNIHELLERVRRMVSAEFEQRLSWDLDYDVSLPELCCDEHQMIQVLINLTRNAAQILIEHAVPDPRIGLKTRVLRQLTIGTRRHKLALELLVIDNGPGIDPVLKHQLFSPLITGRAGGTGLGLHIAQSFVQAHEGQIDANSSAGRTVFKLTLPIQTATHTQQSFIA